MIDLRRVDQQLHVLSVLAERSSGQSSDARKATFKGMTGRWVTVRGNRVFIPDDPGGSLPEWFKKLKRPKK